MCGNVTRAMLFFVMLFVSTSLMAVPNSVVLNRSMWVWDSADELLTDPVAQQAFFDFLKAPHGQSKAKITRIFFESQVYDKNVTPFVLITSYLSGPNADYLRAFINTATEQGVQVEYLDGQAIWAETMYMDDATTISQEAIDYNLASAPGERFSGIHYDIEPNTLGPIWHENPGSDGYNQTLQNNMISICDTIRSQIETSGLSMTLTLDLGSDFAFYVTNLMDVLLAADSPLDYMTILNFFNTYNEYLNGPDGISGVIENLALTSIPLVFGIETSPPPTAPVNISFYQQGYIPMENMIFQLQSRYLNALNFSGIAIEQWVTYNTLSQY